jgi:hypothetical protein
MATSAHQEKRPEHAPGSMHQPTVAQHPEIVTPPAPPGESAPEAVRRTQAVAEALTRLGEDADPKQVADAVKTQSGIDLDPGEVATIRDALRERAQRPPDLDQPPPEDARRRPADR